MVCINNYSDMPKTGSRITFIENISGFYAFL